MEQMTDTRVRELLPGEEYALFEKAHGFLEETYNIVIKPDPGKDGSLSLFYRSGGRALCALHIRENSLTVQIVLGKAEQERFEAGREGFSEQVCALYDGARPYHDGKWLFIPVEAEGHLRDIRALLLMKKRPNKKKAEH